MRKIYTKKTVVSGPYLETYTYNRGVGYGFKGKDNDLVRVDRVRGRRSDAIARARKRLFRLVHANANGIKPLFITLTYVENMTDRLQCISDVGLFIRELKQYLPNFKYIYVVERQERGAWHVHMLIFGSHFLPFEDLNAAWQVIVGGGSTCIKKTNDLQHIGFYFTKYLGKDFGTQEEGQRLYIPSQGLVQPQVFRSLLEHYTPTGRLECVAEGPISNPVTGSFGVMRAYKIIDI